MDDRAEKAWKWLLRGLGIVGFGYLLIKDPNAPVAFYVLLAGLLGLPSVISYQLSLNKEQKRLEELVSKHGRGEDPKDV